MGNETGRQQFKRRQYLVEKKFQLKYVGLILALMFLTAALCSYVVYYTSMISMGEKLANVYPQGRLVSIVNMVNFRILLSVLLVTPLVALIGILLSHRIAGPIFRMEKFLNDMAGGVLNSRLVLRKGDELTRLADGINGLADKMKANIVAEKAGLEKLAGEIDRLKKNPQDSAAAAGRLEASVKSLLRDLDKYKT